MKLKWATKNPASHGTKLQSVETVETVWGLTKQRITSPLFHIAMLDVKLRDEMKPEHGGAETGENSETWC